MDPADSIATRADTEVFALHPNPSEPVACDDIAFDNDIPEVSTNTQPPPTDSLVAPAALDPHHFRAGDAIQFGYEPGGPTGIVTLAEPDDAGLMGITCYGQDSRANPHCVIHTTGCDTCRAFLAAYANRVDREFDDLRARFTSRALDLADHLCDEALILASTEGQACGHGDRYVLSPDAQLPDWLHNALAGAVLTAPEGPWPNWARTCAAVDWPTLINAHPDVLAPDRDMLEYNDGATWEAIAEAFALLRTVDQGAHMDVFFWVGTDGRVLVEPGWIGTTIDVPTDVAATVDDLLVASGRPRHYIHNRGGDDQPDARCGWMVAC